MTLDDKITELSTLPDNWNGNGSLRFSVDVINRARYIAKVLEGCGFECFPTGSDSIQFEKTTCGQYLELEVFANRVESYNETESRLTIVEPDTRSSAEGPGLEASAGLPGY